MTSREQLITLLSEHGLQIPTLKTLRKQGKQTSYYFVLRGVDAVERGSVCATLLMYPATGL
jgi:hypothetical protein